VYDGELCIELQRRVSLPTVTYLD